MGSTRCSRVESSHPSAPSPRSMQTSLFTGTPARRSRKEQSIGLPTCVVCASCMLQSCRCEHRRLSQELIGHGTHDVHRLLLSLHDVSRLGILRQALERAHELARLLCLRLELLVLSHAILELLLAARGLDVLDAHVDALVKDTTLEHLVDEDTHGGLSDVPHTAGTAVVVPVGHTLVDGAVDLDVHEVTQLVGGQVSLHGGKAMVAKPLGEHVARVATHATSPTAPHLCRSHTPPC